MPHRLREELRALVELVLVPGLAAVLPWRLCFSLFRWIARSSKIYQESCASALVQAEARGMVEQPSTWLARRRLVTLIDHADYYLERTRSDRWLRRHVAVEGQWPDPGQAMLLLTFHWGAGMWALRHAAEHGVHAHALAATPTRAHFAGRTVWYHYIRTRVASVARIFRRPTLDVSASLRPALQALQNQEQILAVVDVPADQATASQPVRLCGMRALVPNALFRLAVQRKIPVTVFLAGIDANTSRRTLRIRQLGVYQDQDALIRDVYAELDQAMARDPAAWHFWGEAARFFRA